MKFVLQHIIHNALIVALGAMIKLLKLNNCGLKGEEEGGGGKQQIGKRQLAKERLTRMQCFACWPIFIASVGIH